LKLTEDVFLPDSIDIRISGSKEESPILDKLLCQILWKPLNLSQNVRESFKLKDECLEFVAKVKWKLPGGLVANRTSHKEIEIRDIALSSDAQSQGIGSKLVRQW